MGTSVVVSTTVEHNLPERPFRYPAAEWLGRLHRRFGPVVRVGAGRAGFTYLFGPEANQFVFANSDKFRWREAMGFLAPVDGETSMLLSDGEDHRRRRRLAEPSLRHRRIAAYVPTMVANAESVLDDWRPGDRVDLYDRFRAAIRRTTLETLFGPELAADADVLGADLQVMLDLCDGLPQVVALRQRLRTPLWRRAMAARERVDARILAEVRRRRGTEERDDTVLDALVHGRDADTGDQLDDVEIRDQAVTLIVAGYETTSAALAWAVHGMLTTPGVWGRAATEVSERLDNRSATALTAEDLRHLPYLTGVVQETLRLYPPVVVIARWTGEGLSIAGRTIRPGPSTIISPYVSHRLGETWPDPVTFRPERWIPGDPAWRKPKPYEFLPFGGGPHRCIGASMATTELTAMLAALLARAEISLVPQRIRPTSLVTMRPAGGLHVEVTGVR